MDSQIEITETPNWLKELEAKREKRLRTKLGHELGAGAPCLQCEEKCPGLDLHFWRKICKNCKCSKEDHQVEDEDIYGWAKEELLGTKPTKLKRKFVLPGRKDEVELDWTPTGQKETIDKYLKTLPADLLPIKGSQAAQDRKQLLKKQIPIHDIDPSLCHDLTEDELKQMNEYIVNIKQNSVGVGHLIQVNFQKGSPHIIDKNDAMFLINNVPKGVINSEQLPQYQCLKTENLAKDFGNLSFKPKEVTEDYQNPVDIKYPSWYKNVNVANSVPVGFSPIKTKPYNRNESIATSDISTNLPRTELSYPHDFIKNNNPYENSKSTREGILPSTDDICQNNLQNYPCQSQRTYDDIQNPSETNYKNITYDNPCYLNEANLKRSQLPYLSPEERALYEQQNFDPKEDVQAPVMKNIKDLAYSTFDSNHLKNYDPVTLDRKENIVEPRNISIGLINDLYYDTDIKRAVTKNNELFEGIEPSTIKSDGVILPKCHSCKKLFSQDELAITIPERSNAVFHTKCFKCNGCNQILADMFYFYDKESDNIYCGRDFAKVRGIPRCSACDELIFVKEYCLAENSTFHIKHFCCFECDEPLAGQNYLVENTQPVCLPCFEATKANKCLACKNVIRPDEEGLQLKEGVHFHASDGCFACKVCRKSLFGAKLLFRNDRLYCSHDCFNSDS